MKICTYISAFALSTLMCCCAGSNKETTKPVEEPVLKDSASAKFVPVAVSYTHLTLPTSALA